MKDIIYQSIGKDYGDNLRFKFNYINDKYYESPDKITEKCSGDDIGICFLEE